MDKLGEKMGSLEQEKRSALGARGLRVVAGSKAERVGADVHSSAQQGSYSDGSKSHTFMLSATHLFLPLSIFVTLYF